MRPRIALCALTIAACAGGDDGEDSAVDDRIEMTCEVLADPELCWAVGIAEAYDCIPDADSSGTFDANREVCTLGNGITVTFDEPVAEYRVVVVDGTNPGADAFVQLLLSDFGRRVLAQHGFGSP